MEFKIFAGKRILYKSGNSGWLIGEIGSGHAIINKDGLFLPIYNETEFPKLHNKYTWDELDKSLININDIFFDAFPIDDWIKDYSQYFMTKEDYIKFMESDTFDKRLENAYVSDGEYGYYPISKYTKTWVEKQPFKYVIRNDV